MKALKRVAIASALFGLMIVLMPAQLQAQRSGVEAWSQTCGNCHEIQPPNRYNPEQWHKLMRHMRIVARLSDAEADAILEFLQSGARRIAATEPQEEEGLLVASTEIMLLPLSPTDSAEDWRNLCQACHGESGEGDGPAAVAFNPRPANLALSEFQDSRSDEDLFRVLTEGKGGMPAFSAQMNEARRRAMVTYIRGLGEQD